MLLKGFAVLLIFLIPFFIYSAKRHQGAVPKIIYFTPTPTIRLSPTNSPSVKVGISPSVTQNPPSPSISVQQQVTISPALQQNALGSFIYPNS